MRASKRARPDAARAAPDWSALLTDAVNKPGVISAAYSRFWNYSVGNQVIALFTCMGRGIEPGPIHTFRGWLELGRHVKKGERAISLCMPVRGDRTSPRSVAYVRAGITTRFGRSFDAPTACRLSGVR